MAFYKCARIYVTENSNTEINTASGPIANFNTLLATPLLSLKANFKATQDLHGQSGPYPAGGSAQIWDEQWEAGNISDTTGQNVPHSSLIRSTNYIPCSQETTYYCNLAGKNAHVYCYDQNYDFLGYLDRTNNGSITTLADTKFIRFRMNTAYGATYNNDISINYPSTDTAYHPYSNICPISGVSEVNLYQGADNVIVDDTLVNAYIVNDGSTVSNGGYKCTDFIELDANATNVVERFKTTQSNERLYRVAFYDSNKTFIDFGYSEMITYADFTAVVPIPSGAKYFRACVNVSRELWFIGINGSTTLINLGGTYYGGYVEQDKDGKRELVVTWGSVDLGNLEWVEGGGENLYFYADVPNLNPESSWGTLLNALCEIYTSVSGNAFINTPVNYTFSGQPNFNRVRIRNNDYSNKDDFKTGMSGVYLIYELAEPFTVALPDGERIKSFAGINNIYTDTGDTTIEYRNLTQGG